MIGRGTDFARGENFMDSIRDRLLKEREMLEKKIKEKKLAINKKMEGNHFTKCRSRDNASCRACYPKTICSKGDLAYNEAEPNWLMKAKSKYRKHNETLEEPDNYLEDLNRTIITPVAHNNSWHMFSDFSTIRRKANLIKTNKLFEQQMKAQVLFTK